MINVKDIVYKGLSQIVENVSDAYPQNWSKTSTSQTACDVDDVMSSLGFLRTTCADVPDPSGLKHKQMRYEAIIDCKKQFIYHTK